MRAEAIIAIIRASIHIRSNCLSIEQQAILFISRRVYHFLIDQ
jgi:hypothetical protein